MAWKRFKESKRNLEVSVDFVNSLCNHSLRNANDGAHAKSVLRFGSSQCLDEAACHDGVHCWMVAAHLKNGQESRKSLVVLVQVFVRGEIAQWMTKRNLNQRIQGRVLSDSGEVENFVRIVAFDELEQANHSLIDVGLQGRNISARVLLPISL